MLDILLIAISLSMDAFAVSISLGLNCNIEKHKYKIGFKAGIMFGLFQAIMPLLGIGLFFILEKYILVIKNYLSFSILFIIGLKMIFEALEKNLDEINKNTNFLYLMILGVATSIDAFFVGVSLSNINFNLYLSVLMIGVVTFIFSFFGVVLGRRLGSSFEKKAEVFGGSILILLAVKMLVMK